MKYYVYILCSELDGSYYVGYTHDVQLRILHHNDGWTKSTKAKRPWRLAHVEEYPSRAEAINREKEIKRMKSRTYIRALTQKARDHL